MIGLDVCLGQFIMGMWVGEQDFTQSAMGLSGLLLDSLLVLRKRSYRGLKMLGYWINDGCNGPVVHDGQDPDVCHTGSRGGVWPRTSEWCH